ncbi:retrovirus-related pol polyprotein from transposon TNT 1-94 [Tanacetum coccineum]
MFDFLSSNSSMGEHMESEVTSPNNGDNDFLNDYYNVDATSSSEPDIYNRWKVNGPSLYLLFQKWLKDILAIQISTVASEAAFSTGGRVLDPYRTRLSTMIVEALICTQDWWKVAVENETNLRVKCLKSDNGGEYSSRKFIEYCAENWIRMLKTVSETPQQKGVAERINRTMNERAKSMRLHGSEFQKRNGKGRKLWLRRDGISLLRFEGLQGRPKAWVEFRNTQSLGGTSYTSEGSKNSGSFEDSGRSDEEDSIDGEFSKKGGSKTLQTWSLVRLLAGKKALQSKWVFRVKEEQDDKKMYKAKLVVKGFQQKHRVDYNEIFSPVVKMTTIKLVLSIVASEDLHLEKLYVKTTFLHGDLDEDIYMTQPEGFQSAEKEENLIGHGFDMTEIKKLKRQLSHKFEMRDLGSAKQILGMSIIRDKMKGTLRLSQEKYIGKVLEKFNIKDAEARCQPLRDHFKLSKKQALKTKASRRRMAKVPYALAIGSVMYAMVCTRPDIAHAMGVVSRIISGGCLDSDKSTTRYVFTVGGTLVRWMSRIQECVAMSTTEAEYMAIAEAGKEVLFISRRIQCFMVERSISRKDITTSEKWLQGLPGGGSDDGRRGSRRGVMALRGELKGFKSAGKEENLMCKLKKRLHGLKQALRQWYLKFDSFMQRPWYKRYAMDHCCYLKKVGSSSIILLLYVDDMLVAGFDMAEIKKLKR